MRGSPRLRPDGDEGLPPCGADAGQAVIEYVLITSAVVMALLVAFRALTVALSMAYAAWNTNIYNLWLPAGPGGGP